MQDDFYARQQRPPDGQHPRPQRRQTGLQWEQKLIQEIWKQWTILWKIRNELVHGSNNTTRQAAHRDHTNRELSRIYDQREHLESATQQLLFPEINEHLQRPHWVTRNWIAINTPILRRAFEALKREQWLESAPYGPILHRYYENTSEHSLLEADPYIKGLYQVARVDLIAVGEAAAR